MKRILFGIIVTSILALLVACGSDTEDADHDLVPLEVEFTVSETSDAGETVELHAFVTYGDEDVTDAKVVFEVWNVEDEENSEKFDADNNGDGSYTADYTFDEPGTYEMYAHTDAHNLHTMPKKKIVIE